MQARREDYNADNKSEDENYYNNQGSKYQDDDSHKNKPNTENTNKESKTHIYEIEEYPDSAYQYYEYESEEEETSEVRKQNQESKQKQKETSNITDYMNNRTTQGNRPSLKEEFKEFKKETETLKEKVTEYQKN